MFSKDEVEAIIDELTRKYKKISYDEHEPRNPLDLDTQWEKLLRHAYTGIARADAGVALGDLDPRVIAIIEQFQQKAAEKA
jgi:hypothetical protein